MKSEKFTLHHFELIHRETIFLYVVFLRQIWLEYDHHSEKKLKNEIIVVL
jgi:hypothetical protein